MNLQTKFSKYRMKDPYDFRPFFPFLMSSSPNICPFYAPMAIDTACRFCNKLPLNHRKYYVYSMYARKIQLLYLQHKFKRFIRTYRNIFSKYSFNKPYTANIMLFRKKYWRKWDEYRIIPYLKMYG